MKRHSVLIIDDEMGVLESLSLLLKKDFQVFTASNGEQGLQIINKKSISAVLLDLLMPGMSGIEVLKKIRRDNDDVKVIIMTANSKHDWAKKCADLNVQGYVEKPYDPKKFLERLKKNLGVHDFKVLHEIWGEEFAGRFSSINHVVKKALFYIEKNFQKDVSRKKLASHLKITPEYLSRVFTKECGIKISKYVSCLRLITCKQYLNENQDRSIKEVASSVGIRNAEYFCRFFKSKTGLTPNEFRKNQL